jgi:hypothetical protein
MSKLSFSIPKEISNSKESHSLLHPAQKATAILERALTRNSIAKNEFTKTCLGSKNEEAIKQSLVQECEALEAEIKAIKQEIAFLTQENANWFEYHEKNLESLELLQAKRRVYYEGYLKQLSDEYDRMLEQEKILNEKLNSVENEIKAKEYDQQEILRHKRRWIDYRRENYDAWKIFAIIILIIALIFF